MTVSSMSNSDEQIESAMAKLEELMAAIGQPLEQVPEPGIDGYDEEKVGTTPH